MKNKTDLKRLNIALLLIFSLLIIVNMLILPPKRYGDGNEYFLMLESLSNHFTPDLQQRDIDDFYDGEFNSFNESISPYLGYYKNNNGKFYSIHFWAYPLLNIPAKFALELFGFDVRKTFQITNAILFSSVLAIILFYFNLSEKRKLLFMILLIFSPALWFIHWTHPEIFSFSFCILALIFMNKKKYVPALVSAAVASLQNQPIAFFALFIYIKALIDSKSKMYDLLRLSFFSLIIFIPNIFYLINFGKFHLLRDFTSLSNVSLFRIFELFFDLNLGLFPYMPLTLLFFFGVIFYSFYRAWKEKSFVLELQIMVVMVAMMVVSSMTNNWNHGTTGPSRYMIWQLPFIFFILSKNINLLKIDFLRSLFYVGVFIQALIAFAGFFVFAHTNTVFTPPSLIAINYAPQVYNPSPVIFCNRVLFREGGCDNPTIYKSGGECRKAVLTCKGLPKLREACVNTPEDIDCPVREGWFYVNYPPRRLFAK